MSFNKTIFFSSDHLSGGGNPIHRGNYEEWFLLYIDNELSDEQKKTVEAFIAENTDLKKELDLLFATKSIDGNNISASFKELLFKNETDEALLLYIDNELRSDARKALEEKITQDELLKQSLLELENTISIADNEIVLKDKAALYKEERSAPRALQINRFIRFAAAASIVGAAIAAGWMFIKKQEPMPPVYVSEIHSVFNSDTLQQFDNKPLSDKKQIEAGTSGNTKKANIIASVKHASPSINKPLDEAPIVLVKMSQPTTSINIASISNDASDAKIISIEEKLSQERNIAVASSVSSLSTNDAASFTHGGTIELENDLKANDIDAEEHSARPSAIKGLFRQIKRNIEKRVPLHLESDKVSLFFFTVKDNR